MLIDISRFMIGSEEGDALDLVQGIRVAQIEVFRTHCVECGGHTQDGLSGPGR